MGFNALFKSLLELAMKDTSSATKSKKLYINHSTNYAACELLGIDYEKRNLNDEEILKAKIELKKRMEPLTKEAHNLLLDQYSNSVL